MSGSHVGLQDFALGFLLAEIDEVGSNRVVIRARDIGHSWQQTRVGIDRIARCNLIGVKSCQCVIPQVEKPPNFLVRDGRRSRDNFFGHLTGVVVGNLPLSVFVDVDKGVSCLHLVASGSKGEFVNSNILAPVGTDGHEGLQNFTLGLFKQERIEVIRNRSGIISRNIGDSWQQNTLGSVSAGN